MQTGWLQVLRELTFQILEFSFVVLCLELCSGIQSVTPVTCSSALIEILLFSMLNYTSLETVFLFLCQFVSKMPLLSGSNSVLMKFLWAVLGWSPTYDAVKGRWYTQLSINCIFLLSTVCKLAHREWNPYPLKSKYSQLRYVFCSQGG